MAAFAANPARPTWVSCESALLELHPVDDAVADRCVVQRSIGADADRDRALGGTPVMDDVCGVEPLDEAAEIVAEEIGALVFGGERAAPVESASPDGTADCVRVCMNRIRECAGGTSPNAARLRPFARRPAVVGATREGVDLLAGDEDVERADDRVTRVTGLLQGRLVASEEGLKAFTRRVVGEGFELGMRQCDEGRAMRRKCAP